jgi:hypothetical protein
VADPTQTAAPQSPAPASRSQAIFKSEQKPFDPNDLGFAFEDGANASAELLPPHLRDGNPAQPLAEPAKKNRIVGMTTGQIVLLAGMLIIECCVVIGFAAIYFLNAR